jgi:hypothetical protein
MATLTLGTKAIWGMSVKITVRAVSERQPEDNLMENLDRRTALALALAAASAAALGETAAAQTMEAGKDTTLAPGVVQRVYSEGSSIIPGFKGVSMRDFIMQPGSKTPDNPMKNAMVCHMTEGELRLIKDGKEVVVKKNHVWTCNTASREQIFNDTNTVAVMRIIDLMPA